MPRQHSFFTKFPYTRYDSGSAAFEKQHPNDPAARLCPSTTRIIEYPLAAKADNDLFIVPGGRYLVGHSDKGIFVWDLGYTSSVDCKLITSVGRPFHVEALDRAWALLIWHVGPLKCELRTATISNWRTSSTVYSLSSFFVRLHTVCCNLNYLPETHLLQFTFPRRLQFVAKDNVCEENDMS